jgi:hypothetical protein
MIDLIGRNKKVADFNIGLNEPSICDSRSLHDFFGLHLREDKVGYA